MQIRTEATCIAEEKTCWISRDAWGISGKGRTQVTQVELEHKIFTTCMEAFKYLSNM